MTWIYEQCTGYLRHQIDGQEPRGFLGGYSGCGIGKNNPQCEDQHNLGPIPKGVYRIGDPIDTATHGPFVLPLMPDSANVMHGRSGFLIHGDSTRDPGMASEGCIIQARRVRELIYQSGDRLLEVIE